MSLKAMHKLFENKDHIILIILSFQKKVGWKIASSVEKIGSDGISKQILQQQNSNQSF